jgi:hypothetical protein
VRRKFVDVLKAAEKVRSKKKTGVAEEAVERIKALLPQYVDRSLVTAAACRCPDSVNALHCRMLCCCVSAGAVSTREKIPRLPESSRNDKDSCFALVLFVLFPSEAETRGLPLGNTPSRPEPAALLFSFPDDSLSNASFFVYGTSM